MNEQRNEPSGGEGGFRYSHPQAAGPSAPSAATTSAPPPTSAGASPSSSRADATDEPRPVSDALHGFGDLIAELKTYATLYLTAQADRIKVSIRNMVLFAVLGLAMLVIALAFAVVSAALLLIGAAHGLGSAFGPGMDWLGDLIIGVVVVGGVGVTIFTMFGRISRAMRRTLEQKYEALRIQQRVRHGRDAAQRAARQSSR